MSCPSPIAGDLQKARLMPRTCSDDGFPLKGLGPKDEERSVGLGNRLLEEVLGGPCRLRRTGQWVLVGGASDLLCGGILGVSCWLSRHLPSACWESSMKAGLSLPSPQLGHPVQAPGWHSVSARLLALWLLDLLTITSSVLHVRKLRLRAGKGLALGHTGLSESLLSSRNISPWTMLPLRQQLAPATDLGRQARAKGVGNIKHLAQGLTRHKQNKEGQLLQRPPNVKT